jgi:tripartite-type tricarboxylate transporter receptor subunit TctC
MKELGINMEYTVWSAMFTPAGVPMEIQKALDAALQKAAADPAVVEAFKKSGTPLSYQNQATFRNWWDEDYKRLDAIIKVIVEKEKNERKG